MLVSIPNYTDSENGYYKINELKTLLLGTLALVLLFTRNCIGTYTNQIIGNGLYLVSKGGAKYFFENLLYCGIILLFLTFISYLLVSKLGADIIFINILLLSVGVVIIFYLWGRFKLKIIEVKNNLLQLNTSTSTVVSKKG